MQRRHFLLSPLAIAWHRARAEVAYAQVELGVALIFPRDHGSHPAFRTEWWYVTGVAGPAGAEIGVQITFFRSRPGVAEAERSRFAQRAARAGFDLAEASEVTTDIHIEDWSLALRGDIYVARIAARDFSLALEIRMRQPPLLQGDDGVSRKGPSPAQASYYYSIPQLELTGTIAVEGHERRVDGVAWLDHEWSSAYLAPEARGWDWIGINFDDGGALMAFRIRDREGRPFWAGGAFRDGNGRRVIFRRDEVRFEPVRTWRSPRTNFDYPVAMRIVAGTAQSMGVETDVLR